MNCSARQLPRDLVGKQGIEVQKYGQGQVQWKRSDPSQQVEALMISGSEGRCSRNIHNKH
jgi:hypothetical protein